MKDPASRDNNPARQEDTDSPTLFETDQDDVDVETLLLDPVDDSHPVHQDVAHRFDAVEAAALRDDLERTQKLPKGYLTAGGRLLISEGIQKGWINCDVDDTVEVAQ